MAETLLDVHDVAGRLSVSTKTVYRMIYAGLLEPRPVGLGKKRPRVRIAESDLARYIAATGNSETPPGDAQPPSRPPASPPPPPRPTAPPRGRAA